MTLKLTGGGVAVGVVALAGLGVALYLYNKRAGILGAVGGAANLINPMSRDNLAYTSVNGLGEVITGREFSLGADIRDAAEAGLGSANTGAAPVDYVIDSVLYPVNAAVRAVKEKAKESATPEEVAANPWIFGVGA